MFWFDRSSDDVLFEVSVNSEAEKKKHERRRSCHLWMLNRAKEIEGKEWLTGGSLFLSKQNERDGLPFSRRWTSRINSDEMIAKSLLFSLSLFLGVSPSSVRESPLQCWRCEATVQSTEESGVFLDGRQPILSHFSLFSFSCQWRLSSRIRFHPTHLGELRREVLEVCRSDGLFRGRQLHGRSISCSKSNHFRSQIQSTMLLRRWTPTRCRIRY